MMLVKFLSDTFRKSPHKSISYSTFYIPGKSVDKIILKFNVLMNVIYEYCAVLAAPIEIGLKSS